MIALPEAQFVPPTLQSSDIVAPSDLAQDRSQPELQHAALTVLIVDDNRDNVEMLTEYLHVFGHRALAAQNGVEALDKARSQHPDIVLMDIQMPVMDGLETIRYFKADARLAQIPIIALTALAMRGDKERCLEAGADEYLSKPLKLKDLLKLIMRLCP